MVSRHGNKTGINVGTTLSSKSPERRAKHLKAPCTTDLRKNYANISRLINIQTWNGQQIIVARFKQVKIPDAISTTDALDNKDDR